MPSIAVYCGSRLGRLPAYREAAAITGKIIVNQGFSIVYGGGQAGLMGVLADHALAEKGQVIGVIPRFLREREVAHKHLTHCYEVQSMQERKSLMEHLAEGFIILPGGFGTLDELAEILTFAQLELPALKAKPIGILNLHHYYDHLLAQFEHQLAEEFTPVNLFQWLIVSTDPVDLVHRVVQCIRSTSTSEKVT